MLRHEREGMLYSREGKAFEPTYSLKFADSDWLVSSAVLNPYSPGGSVPHVQFPVQLHVGVIQRGNNVFVKFDLEGVLSL